MVGAPALATDPAECGDRRLGICQRLAVPALLILEPGNALALDRLRRDHSRPPITLERLRERGVDRGDVVSVDCDRTAAERACPLQVMVDPPPVHRLSALAEPVDIDDHDEVVESVVGCVLECLPDRALRHLAVSAQDPDAIGRFFQSLAGERDTDANGKAEAERTGCDVDPGEQRRRMPLQPAAERTEAEQLLFRDRPRCQVQRVQQGRSVALGEDHVVVQAILGLIEVVAEVLREEDSHQVGS